MKLPILVFAGLLSGVASSLDAPEGWVNGEQPTGTTDPVVTDKCTYWANNISANATCSQVESYFNISFDQLHGWNPSLLRDWCVLIEGWSYCVQGPAITAPLNETNTGSPSTQYIFNTTDTDSAPANTSTSPPARAPTNAGNTTDSDSVPTNAAISPGARTTTNAGTIAHSFIPVALLSFILPLLTLLAL